MPREGQLLAQAGSHSQKEPEQGLDPVQMDALSGSQALSYLHMQMPGTTLAPGK